MVHRRQRSISSALLGLLALETVGGQIRQTVFREDVFQNPLQNVFIGGTSQFGHITLETTPDDNNGPNTRRQQKAVPLVSAFGQNRLQDGRDWPFLWTATGTADLLKGKIPPFPLFVDFPSGINVRPNDTITSGLMLQEPRVTWEVTSSRLHTLVMVDKDASPNFVHWLVVNIPGNRVSEGEVIAPYHPSFTFGLDGDRVIQDDSITHRYLWLVFSQNDRVQEDPLPDLCSENGSIFRQVDFTVLKQGLGLGALRAGNFHLNSFSGENTKNYICTMSRCVGEPWPILLPGFNDNQECLNGP